MTQTIDMDTKCAECGKPSATPSGICLACVNKALGTKPMKSPQGWAVRERIKRILEERR